MRIALVRHGETDWNRIGRMQGRADIPLNEAGIRQMAQCGEALCLWHWGRVVSSPLCRARQSAELLARAVGVARVDLDGGLMERDYGDGTGLTESEREYRYPAGSCPGLESWESLADRMLRSLSRLAVETFEARSGNLLVVSHGTAIQAALGALLAEGGAACLLEEDIGAAGDFSRISLKNSSVTLLQYTNGQLLPERVNLSPEKAASFLRSTARKDEGGGCIHADGKGTK